jgi:UDPglucose 6-dehydrogenase
MKLCVIGTGYVGLVSGACFADIGHEVTCVDNDDAKVAMLRSGHIPIYEPGLQEMVAANVAEGRLTFSGSIADGVRGAKVIFICVGTPSKPTGEANLVYVENVSTEIAEHMEDYVVVVEKSTVPVQTGEWIRTVLSRNNPKNVCFDVVSNPEFLREGTALEDNMHPDRIVVGTDSENAAEVMRELYAPIIEKTGCPFLVTDIRTAELIKHASNAFLATKISFINAVANICERAGADVRLVADGMGLDKRIGRQFLNAGAGYGGSCFPKDVRAFIHIAHQLGYDFELLKAVADINEGQKKSIVRKVKEALWNLEGKRIAVWGLAFKPDTDDLRNAPALDVIGMLLAQGAEIIACDPQAMDKARELLPGVKMASDCYDAVTDAECLVVMTEWREFAEADLDKVKELMRHPIVVDGRNMWDHMDMEARGFTYVGVGV